MSIPVAVDFQQGISTAWQNVAVFVPKLIAALVIIVVGYILAKLLARIISKVLERVGFDSVVERGGVRQALAKSKYDPSDILAKLVYWVVLLVTLQIAFGLFGPNPVSRLLEGLIAYLPNVFVAIVILVIVAFLAKGLKDLLGNLLSALPAGPAIATAASMVVLAVGLFAALDQLRIAPRIVTGLWYALLAAAVGSLIVAVGGGGIRTMQRYWERAANSLEAQAPAYAAQVKQQAQQQQAQKTSLPSTGAGAGSRSLDDTTPGA